MKDFLIGEYHDSKINNSRKRNNSLQNEYLKEYDKWYFGKAHQLIIKAKAKIHYVMKLQSLQRKVPTE